MDVAQVLVGLTWGASLVGAFGGGIWYSMRLRQAEQAFQAEERKKAREFESAIEASRQRTARALQTSMNTTGPTQPQPRHGSEGGEGEADLVELDVDEDRTPLRKRAT